MSRDEEVLAELQAISGKFRDLAIIVVAAPKQGGEASMFSNIANEPALDLLRQFVATARPRSS